MRERNLLPNYCIFSHERKKMCTMFSHENINGISLLTSRHTFEHQKSPGDEQFSTMVFVIAGMQRISRTISYTSCNFKISFALQKKTLIENTGSHCTATVKDSGTWSK